MFFIFFINFTLLFFFFFFFFNDTATTEIYTLSLHDALPISGVCAMDYFWAYGEAPSGRSEEHTSELQSHSDLVCRLLLEKKKKKIYRDKTKKNKHTIKNKKNTRNRQ